MVRLRLALGRAGEKLAAIGAAIVWPFERTFSRLGQKVVTVSDRVEGVESILVRIGWALAWPVRMVWRLARAVAAVCVPESARHALAAPMRGLSRLGRGTGRSLVRVAEALNLDGIVLWIVRRTRYLWYPFTALWGFFQAWLATRSTKKLLWGLPVVAVLVPLAGIAVW
ncbi:MAG TPA: hypothetical protein VJ828_02850, partial [Lacipirellulaceae bacterium]|nr:hypothetical protein [Lacipirellulaceae bacterium]